MDITVIVTMMENMNIIELRKEADMAGKTSEACNYLYDKLKNYKGDDAVVWAYKALSSFLMANYVFSPFSKLHYFNEGKEHMHTAIMKDPQNIEVRFVRLALQLRMPSFLGYSDHIEEDKKMILHALKNNLVKDNDLLQKILTFVKQNRKVFTEKELQSAGINE